MKRHIFCNYGKWKDEAVVTKMCYMGAALIQSRTCKECGKRVFRKSHIGTASDVHEVERKVNINVA